MKYRAEIDGLRAVAVLPVLFFHANVPGFGGGFVGVDIFFVISGYLITGILLRELETKQFSIWSFYERRARRILPALVFVVLCCIPIAWIWLLPPDMESFAKSVIAVATFSSNIFFWQESGYFDTATEMKPLLHTWSLAVEEQFYILFPLCLIALYRNPLLLKPAMCMGLVASLALAHWGAYMRPNGTFYLLPTRAWELLAGALIASHTHHGFHLQHRWIREVLSVVGAVAIGVSIFIFDKTTPFPSLYAVPIVLGTTLILLYARTDTIVNKALSLKWLVGLGLISYSAYLWHQPLLAFHRHRFSDAEHLEWVIVLLALPLAWLTWRFVERPFRQGGLPKTRHRALWLSVSALSLTACVGFALNSNNGMMQRYTPETQRIFQQYAQGPTYVPRRFDQLRQAAFSSDSKRPRILVIGDSFAQDMVNALYESRQEKLFDISTAFVSDRCGNLFVQTDISQYQKTEDRMFCTYVGGYDEPELLARMQAADEIWLISSWEQWTNQFLPQSIENIRAATNGKIVVFGRKHFGHRSLTAFNSGGLNALLGREALPQDLAHVASDMANRIPAYAKYIDLQNILCGGYEACTNDTGEKFPISFDGSHLTPKGAKMVGEKLRDTLSTRWEERR